MIEKVRSQVGNTVEIRRGEKTDIILNLSASDQSSVHYLASLPMGRYAVPEGWFFRPVTPWWEAYVDDADSPSFFLKSRVVTAPVFRDSGGSLKRANSVLNEMLIAPRIKEVLSSNEAQGLLEGSNFDAISYVEPLVAVIARESTFKTVIYPFVDGKTSIPRSNDFYDLAFFATGLKELFRKAGVEPWDLGYRQFIVSNSNGMKTANLIDAQAYERRRTE
jgi:hypothetical protein